MAAQTDTRLPIMIIHAFFEICTFYPFKFRKRYALIAEKVRT